MSLKISSFHDIRVFEFYKGRDMLHFILGFFGLWMAQFSLGQIDIKPSLPQYQDSDDEDEDSDEENISDESNSISPNEELEIPDFKEIKDLKKIGLGLAIGSIAPWQQISLGFDMDLGLSDWDISSNLGLGKYYFKGIENKISYENSLSARSLYVGGKYFFTEELGFYLFPGLSFSMFDGDINPKGSDQENSASLNNAIKSGYQATGLGLGGSIGFLKIWPNGMAIDYSFLGFSKLLYVKSEISNETDSNEKIISKTLQSVLTWGFVNIKLAYYF